MIIFKCIKRYIYQTHQLGPDTDESNFSLINFSLIKCLHTKSHHFFFFTTFKLNLFYLQLFCPISSKCHCVPLGLKYLGFLLLSNFLLLQQFRSGLLYMNVTIILLYYKKLIVLLMIMNYSWHNHINSLYTDALF